MSNRFPEVTDAASLDAWIRARGFDPYEYDGSDGEPPPWAEWEYIDGAFVAYWPLINTERRMMGVITEVPDA